MLSGEYIPLLTKNKLQAFDNISNVETEQNKVYLPKKHKKLVVCTIVLLLCFVTIGMSFIVDMNNMIIDSEIISNSNMLDDSNTTVAASVNPHIIWFIVDDLGNADISLQGAEYSTPNIDSLAYNGIQLKQHYTSPICSPSRAAFLSGRFAHTMGLSDLDDLLQPTTIAHLPSRYLTLANMLKTIGYKTYAYGKWHLGYSKQSYTPTSRGFDHHFGYYQYAINQFSKHNLKGWKRNGYDFFKDGEVYWKAQDISAYATKLISDQIEEDITDVANGNANIAIDDVAYQQMFMYIAFQNPHFPIETPKDMYDGYNGDCEELDDVHNHRVRYCRDVKYLDHVIGRVLQLLKDNDMYDNSLILMATDNGPLILNSCVTRNEFPSAGSAWPYRGTKYTYLQGGILTPAFISGGVIDSENYGKKNFHVWHAADWFKTILHFTNFWSIYEKIHSKEDLIDNSSDSNSDSDISSDMIDISNIQFDSELDSYYAPKVNTIKTLLVKEMDGQDMYNILFDDRYLTNNDQLLNIPLSLVDRSEDYEEQLREEDQIFLMSNRDFLILGISKGGSKEFVETGILLANGYKLLINETFTGNCDVRSPKPGSKSWTAIVPEKSWPMDKCELCLFDIINDPYETVDLLDYQGANSPSYSNYETIIEEALSLITEQWAAMVSGNTQYSQSFNVFFNLSSNSSAYGINGAHQPFQAESEPEFPNACNICEY